MALTTLLCGDLQVSRAPGELPPPVRVEGQRSHSRRPCESHLSEAMARLPHRSEAVCLSTGVMSVRVGCAGEGRLILHHLSGALRRQVVDLLLGPGEAMGPAPAGAPAWWTWASGAPGQGCALFSQWPPVLSSPQCAVLFPGGNWIPAAGGGVEGGGCV